MYTVRFVPTGIMGNNLHNVYLFINQYYENMHIWIPSFMWQVGSWGEGYIFNINFWPCTCLVNCSSHAGAVAKVDFKLYHSWKDSNRVWGQSPSKLAQWTPNLAILWISVCSFWLCGSIVANPIIYRLVPSPSRYEIRQCTWTRHLHEKRLLNLRARQ